MSSSMETSVHLNPDRRSSSTCFCLSQVLSRLKKCVAFFFFFFFFATAKKKRTSKEKLLIHHTCLMLNYLQRGVGGD